MQTIISRGIMSPLDGKHCLMFVVEIAVLFFGIFLKSSICLSSGTNETCRQKNLLFVSAKKPDRSFHFPTNAVYRDNNGSQLCFNVQANKTYTDCCNSRDFNCSFEISGNENNYSLTLNKEVLSKQDIVLMAVPDADFKCMPSQLYNKSSEFLLNMNDCLNKGSRNIRLSQNSFCEKSLPYDEQACQGLAETDYKLTFNGQTRNCVPCMPPGKNPNISITIHPSASNDSSLENAVNIMKNLSSYLKQMGNANSAAIIIGNIKGLIMKLPSQNKTNINFGITTNDDLKIPEDNNVLETGFSQLVQIPKEACDMAGEKNGSFAGVVFFPEMHQADPESSFLNNEVVGIEMGTDISNLSHTIDIHYRNVDKNGSIASCRSWDGKGKESTWITDGCQTNETNDSITCQCSHLTFFAILLSPPPGNISSSDFTSLTYITSIGCGLSMFFLAVTFFMHCLIRKGKASQATKILINLFVAMFTLNLCFLTNESVAELGNFGICVAMAALMHYTMLATFTWFFIEGLHLYFNLRKLPSEIKHYTIKLCITGWVTPAVVVFALLVAGKYDYLVIHTENGNSATMCWISDPIIHQGVNVGYYAIVFIFTFSIFIVTVQQIFLFKPTARKALDARSIKKNTFSILGLLLLLGITWAFAFFSHGPLLIPSYYIFSILNSFQGFFLSIYYYNSSRKIVGEDRSYTVSSKSTVTSNTAVNSVYK